MPTAFALAHGLDWDTELDSFWTWLHDARVVTEEDGEINSLVRELVAGQQEMIEALAAKEVDPDAARFTLTVAVALVGHHYSSNQKLLNALKEAGLINSVGQPMSLGEISPNGPRRVP